MADSITIENKENDLTFELDNLVISGTVPLDDYYTKEQTDSMFDNYYDKQEVDDKIANIEVTAGNYTGGTGINVSDENVISVDTETVALKSDIPDTSEFVTETGLSGRVIPTDSASSFENNDLIMENSNGGYAKVMGNTSANLGFATSQNANGYNEVSLTGYYGLKFNDGTTNRYWQIQRGGGHLRYYNSSSGNGWNFDDVATQDYVDSAISNISQFQIVKVDVLPETGESNKLYLVPSDTTETDNIYNEYLWVEISTDTFDWELIGTTQIDLSNYYTKTELDGRIIPEKSTLVNTEFESSGNLVVRYTKNDPFAYVQGGITPEFSIRGNGNIKQSCLSGTELTFNAGGFGDTVGRISKNSDNTGLQYTSASNTGISYDFNDVATNTSLNGRVIPQDSNSNWADNGRVLNINSFIDAYSECSINLLNSNNFVAGSIYKRSGSHTSIRYKNRWKDEIGFENASVDWDFDDVQIQITGNKLVDDLTGTKTLNVNKVYICTENDTSNTYLAGHLYKISRPSGAYIATDITPKISTVESQSSTMSDLYDNCTTLIGQGKKIKYFTLTPTQDFTVSCSSINIATTGNITNTERNFTILGTDNTYTFYLNAINTEYGTMSFACNYYSVAEGWNMQIYTDTMSGDTEWHGNIVNFSNGTNIAGFEAEIVPTNYPITIYYE